MTSAAVGKAIRCTAHAPGGVGVPVGVRVEALTAGAVSDEELVRRVRGGCEASFEALDGRMRPRLVAALHRRVRDHATCEDVAQQALLQAYRQISRYDERWRFSTWLFTIAFRLAVDESRRRKREAERGRSATRVSIEHASAEKGPLQRTASEELRGNLWAAADAALSDAEYTVLWLRFGEGLDAAEVARVTGKTNVHVRVLQHRATKKLRKALDERGGAEVWHAG